ncbi:DNA primase family protein [Bacillus sp. AFS088145]|uniref:DNA primase family protein n=1 Tax=Bacillus sp. AFS088145 TaxID=2033514 RepID=UPI000BF961AD|nr:DNA primase family protein [Bacillus sp. AFS088145]PFH81619.1 hypothetical protein COI44_22855 [Bacillus sp. AFS088145]
MTIISNIDENKTSNDENIENFQYDKRFFSFETNETTGKVTINYDHVGHATSIIQEFLLVRNAYGFYYYDQLTGLWKEDGANFIRSLITKRQGIHSNEHRVRQCYTNIFNRIYKNSKERMNFDTDPYLINMENGVVNLKTGELLPFNPYYLQRIKVPHNYVPGAKCPKIKQFLIDVVGEAQAKFLIEWIGYGLIKNYPMRKILILLGKGKNGKSIYIQLLNLLMGRENVSNVSLHDLQTHKFALAELDGKLVNTCADIDSSFFNSLDRIKGLTGGDSQMAERKNGHPFSFVNHAKLTFSCNSLPTFKERTFAIKDRFIVLPFDNTFSGDKKNDNLLAEISTKEELEGLVFMAIQAITAVLEKGEFSITPKMELATQSWFDEMDNVKLFINEACTLEADNYVIKGELYDNYKLYCSEAEYSPLGKINFFKHLVESFPFIYTHEGKDPISRKSVVYYKHIGLKK